MNKQEETAIDKLQKLAGIWPDTLLLFSWSGSLVVVRRATGEVVANIYDTLINDGGDPGCIIRDGKEYIVK